MPLPPSALILLALSDLRKCEADPTRFLINMGTWHSPGDGLCRVCLAGAILAQTFKIPDDEIYVPRLFFMEDLDRALLAIDRFHLGWIDDGLKDLGLTLPKGMKPLQEIPEYSEEPEAFHQALTTLAQTFAAHGL